MHFADLRGKRALPRPPNCYGGRVRRKKERKWISEKERQTRPKDRRGEKLRGGKMVEWIMEPVLLRKEYEYYAVNTSDVYVLM